MILFHLQCQDTQSACDMILRGCQTYGYINCSYVSFHFSRAKSCAMLLPYVVFYTNMRYCSINMPLFSGYYEVKVFFANAHTKRASNHEIYSPLYLVISLYFVLIRWIGGHNPCFMQLVEVKYTNKWGILAPNVAITYTYSSLLLLYIGISAKEYSCFSSLLGIINIIIFTRMCVCDVLRFFRLFAKIRLSLTVYTHTHTSIHILSLLYYNSHFCIFHACVASRTFHVEMKKIERNENLG